MSAPKDVVWREDRWPNQWIGMHLHHSGGIRCNSRAEAEQFMRELCGARGCAWVSAYSPTYQCGYVGCNDVAVQGGLCVEHDKKEGR